MFSLICAWIYAWVNNRKAGDLRRHRTHYDVIVMFIANALQFLQAALRHRYSVLPNHAKDNFQQIEHSLNIDLYGRHYQFVWLFPWVVQFFINRCQQFSSMFELKACCWLWYWEDGMIPLQIDIYSSWFPLIIRVDTAVEWKNRSDSSLIKLLCNVWITFKACQIVLCPVSLTKDTLFVIIKTLSNKQWCLQNTIFYL